MNLEGHDTEWHKNAVQPCGAAFRLKPVSTASEDQ
jgi:hypothetical protein